MALADVRGCGVDFELKPLVWAVFDNFESVSDAKLLIRSINAAFNRS